MLTKKQDETIEFFTPAKGFDVRAYLDGDDYQSIHHIGRYQWAQLALLAKNPSSVVDIACGAGYGAFMIASVLPNAGVIGADYDEHAVQYARTKHVLQNLSFKRGDLVTGTLDGEPMRNLEALVSFDTIEHIAHRELALVRMADALKDDGWLLLSTPSAHIQSILEPTWEHHKIEYSDSDLFAVLSRFFGRIIQPQDEDFPASGFWTETMNSSKLRYSNLMNPVICTDPIRIAPYRRRA